MTTTPTTALRAVRDRVLWTLPPDRHAVFVHAPAPLAVTTPAGTITAANTALGALLGRDPATLIGVTLLEITHPDDLDHARHADSVLPAAGPVSRGERRLRLNDGRTIWVALTVAPLPPPSADGGRRRHLVVHVEDITGRRRREADLTHRALHDPLTGLANRALLTTRIAAAIARHGRHTRPSHLFYLDLNGFKTVNDRHGHAAGDAVLVQFAARLAGLLRVGDTAARLGGDEFVVLCEDTDPSHARTITARLRAAAAQPFTVDGRMLTLSAAVGDCPVRRGDTPADLLRTADQRMYRTKRRG